MFSDKFDFHKLTILTYLKYYKSILCSAQNFILQKRKI